MVVRRHQCGDPINHFYFCRPVAAFGKKRPMKSIPLGCLAAALITTAPNSMAGSALILVAGGGDQTENAPATSVKLTNPFGTAFDKAGNTFLVEMAGGERVRKIAPNGLLTTVGGTGVKGYSGDGGPAVKAQFNGMHSLVVSPNGDIFLADTWNNRVRKIDSKSGVVTLVAGSGPVDQHGFSGDGGSAIEARFGGIYCLAFDSKAENLYLADLDNRRIRAINLKSGIVRTVAGNGQKGVPPDGADAATSPLVDPRAVAVDGKGNIYVLERSGNALRVVDGAGKIRTVAGTGQKGLSGDGGNALAATMNGPKHLCVDREGNVLIADTENHVIRKYQPKDGRIIRVAGTGKKGSAGVGGPPELAEFNQPHGVTVAPNGQIYISDASNGRVLRIER
jgi:sugar lactone lactonase YvrE